MSPLSTAVLATLANRRASSEETFLSGDFTGWVLAFFFGPDCLLGGGEAAGGSDSLRIGFDLFRLMYPPISELRSLGMSLLARLEKN